MEIRNWLDEAKEQAVKITDTIGDTLRKHRSPVKTAVLAVLLTTGSAAAYQKCHSRELDLLPYDQQSEALRKSLSAKFGEQSADFALKTIQNGQKIKEHPHKELELAKIKQEIQSRYSPSIRPLKLFGYCDETREAEQIATLHSARREILNSKTKYKHQLPVEFLIAGLSQEGHSLNLDHGSANSTNGFDNYGNDNFGSEFKRIAAAGFIDKSFQSEFKEVERINEKGQKVISANFKSKKAAFRAFVAMMIYNQYLFYEDLQKRDIPLQNLSHEERLFYTYYYYNAGPNSLEKTLKTEKDVHAFFGEMKNVGARVNAYQVVTGALWLEKSGALEQESPENYFWYKTIPSPGAKKTTDLGNSAEEIEQNDLEIPYYYFDEARVTKPWLWLLKTAREEGWTGKMDGKLKGLRTIEEQEKLFLDYKKGKGKPAFDPHGDNKDSARHMVGNVKKMGPWAMAVDVSDAPQLIEIAKKHGIKLHRPYAHERWHVEAKEAFEAGN